MSSNMNQAAVLNEKIESARQRALAIAKEHSSIAVCTSKANK